MANIVILGSGGFGTSLAVMTHRYGHNVTVWSAFENEIEAIKRDGEHKKLLPGHKISPEIKLTTDISCVTDKDIILFAIPSAFLRKVAIMAKPYVTSKSVIVNTGKGLEDKTFNRLSDVLKEEFPENKITILSGPSHAEEVVKSMPTTVVVASDDIDAAYYVQDILSNEAFRIYVSDDVVGCELGGSLKNIIALCAGICDGMNYGDNTKAALMTRGIAEIARLGVAMGARADTFAGLTGIGDLIVTCTSMHSRNRRAGILIGQGVSPQKAVEQVGTVEGYWCAKVAYELSKKVNIEMPITEQLYNVLFNEKDLKETISELMGRPRRHESEDKWLPK
jgi:glycerol-3-phosphate dehydrogenase (NAD(P)+)